MLAVWGSSVAGQEFKVDYDKKRDFAKYKTFRFGETEIITPKDQRQANENDFQKWVKNAVAIELESKGLQQVDSAADLVVSFAIGSLARSDAGNVGPMGMTPGSTERTYLRDYRQGSLIIDLNDQGNFLVWRVSATSDFTGPSAERMIDQIVQKGFKPYPKPGKSKKKKK